MLFDSPEYGRGNSDAHRARPTNLHVPALTWHMAYWINKNSPVGDHGPSRDYLKRKLDQIVVGIFAEASRNSPNRDVFLKPFVGERYYVLFSSIYDQASFEEPVDINADFDGSGRIKDIFYNDYRVVVVKFPWGRFDITARFEVHYEFFTVTFYAEMPKDANFQDIVSFKNILLRKDNIERPIDDALDPVELGGWIYYDFWKEFNQYFMSIARNGEMIDCNNFGHVFADFRGIIISDDIVDRSEPGPDDQAVKRNWEYPIIHAFRPLITNKDRYECTASLFLGGRALYFTALGPQQPDFRIGERIPVTYLICTKQGRGGNGEAEERDAARPEEVAPKIVNRWQLGRLLERIHAIGTFRLAALRELEALRDASLELNKLDPVFAEARNALGASVHKVGDMKRMARSIGNVRSKLNDVTNGFLEHGANPNKSGLVYRLERARLYIKQFYKLQEGLRISRIEGYQQYDQFVDRKLGTTFEFIDSFGKRYERAAQDSANLDQTYLTIKSNQLSESVRNIQEKGELILIAVLIPYYIIAALYYTASEKNPALQVVEIAVSAFFLAIFAKTVIIDRRQDEAGRDAEGATRPDPDRSGRSRWAIAPLIADPARKVLAFFELVAAYLRKSIGVDGVLFFAVLFMLISLMHLLIKMGK